MAKLSEIVDYCTKRLEMAGFIDFPGAHNGLQVENDGNVKKIACAVDATSATIEAAAQIGADFLLVHHGLFWKAPIPLAGTTYKKFKRTFDANLAVFSCHLPLDCHRELGHNALLAKALELPIIAWDLPYEGHTFAAICDASGTSRDELAARLKKLFPRTFKEVLCGNANLSRVAILCGSGNTAVPAMRAMNCDTLICGEVKHSAFADAQEFGLNLFPCGHYATEALGVKALGAELSRVFGVSAEFIEEDCVL